MVLIAKSLLSVKFSPGFCLFFGTRKEEGDIGGVQSGLLCNSGLPMLCLIKSMRLQDPGLDSEDDLEEFERLSTALFRSDFLRNRKGKKYRFNPKSGFLQEVEISLDRDGELFLIGRFVMEASSKGGGISTLVILAKFAEVLKP